MHWAGRRAPTSTRATEIIEEAQPSPQAQGRDHHAQEDRILQEVMPQIMRRSDCEIWYNYVHSRYKASIYLNGQKIQDLSDFSLQELKGSLRLEIKQLDAASSLLLTTRWTSEPCACDPKVEAFQIQATKAKDAVSAGSVQNL